MQFAHPLSRRELLASSACLLGGSLSADEKKDEIAADAKKALIAVTLDLEMSRNFPTWETTHWDYEKGNLNAETKKYTVEACRRVKAAGGVLHCFAVGRVLEQENVDWIKDIAKQGHPIGNHTYDHVNVLATKPADIQFRFNRAPWLIEGKQTREVIRENIRMTSAAVKSRIGVEPVGFRTPGGFATGLKDRPDVQQMLAELGFSWVSSLYPAHEVGKPQTEPAPAVYESIVKAQQAAQPFVYDKGLIEVPMSPISDIGAFRGGRWKLEWFLRAIRLAIEAVIDQHGVFDFLGHPSCLYVVDPEFRAIDLICDLVKKAGNSAALVDVTTLARRARQKKPG
jgi:hypothetical protein